MPEIGEVARIVHYLRKHLVNRTIAAVQVQEDDIIYGKVGTSAEAFKAAITGKKVLGARQQGKYFWLEMSSPPHPLMHFGMTGWMKFSNDDSAYYKPTKADEDTWPPKYWKFVLETEGKGGEKCEAAFVDSRRLARIRLVDVPAEEMRKTTPLKENGPDPVIDKDVLTLEWLSDKMKSKRVPVKALLLDQANISGVGNWVADEVLYQARIHPEQYSNTLGEEQLKRLHDSLVSVCTTAVETRAESSQFPDTWLMKHRWNKGKKEGNVLPNGDKIIHITVGGRTSAVVPNVQKKSGPVAADVPSEVDGEQSGGEAGGEEEAKKPKKSRGKAAAKSKGDGEAHAKEPVRASKRGQSKKTYAEDDEPIDNAEEEEEEEEEEKEEEDGEKPMPKKRKIATGKPAKGKASTGTARSKQNAATKVSKADEEVMDAAEEDGSDPVDDAEEGEDKPTSKKRKTATAKPAKGKASMGTARSKKNAATKAFKADEKIMDDSQGDAQDSSAMEESEEDVEPAPRPKRKAATKSKPKAKINGASKKAASAKKETVETAAAGSEDDQGRRRSTRGKK
ncbi:hypothetical protein B0A49_02406 [Cryomyces minteri]|uniref:Formamidopyrimidine-DNA glycosylase catalytic domain-containing protein n=1 Tax=Cryomyces minteri TaxID=331657 RepID=A0A4U0XI78_9PEZI|nr:hypothetical protein B0A49_02406 [Cryomyces minteri]